MWTGPHPPPWGYNFKAKQRPRDLRNGHSENQDNILRAPHRNFVSRTCFVCSALHTDYSLHLTQRPLLNGGRLTLLRPLSILFSWEPACHGAACRARTRLNAPKRGGSRPFEVRALLLNTFLPDLALKRRFWNWTCELRGSVVWNCTRTMAFGSRETLSSIPRNLSSRNLRFIHLSLTPQKSLQHHLRFGLKCTRDTLCGSDDASTYKPLPPPITSLSPWFPAVSYLCACVIHFKTMKGTEVWVFQAWGWAGHRDRKGSSLNCWLFSPFNASPRLVLFCF